MVYSSLLFIYGFLPVSLLIYYVMPDRFREKVLLILSMIFCGFWGLKYLGFMVVHTLVNYAIGRLISRFLHVNGLSPKIALASGILFNTVVIFFFRTEFFGWLRELLTLPESFFPVGVSLITLSATGYLIDVYSGRIRAERDIVRFGLYIMMFPRIIMGPVVRYQAFRGIMDKRRCSLDEIGIGFTIFVKGLAKKVLAADTLYMLYKAVRSVDVEELSAFNAWLGIIAYVLCLYFTLSGFADMGTGIGYCFGCRFPQSFNYPLFSGRLRWFAAKWHVQVVHWFRKYLTRPLYNLTERRWLRNLILIGAWAAAGLWYGFTLNSVIWGTLIGIGLVAESYLSGDKMLKATGVLYTLVLTLVFAVFLSGDTPSYSLRYLLAMVGGNNVLADSLTIYLLRSYLVVLLISMYASTDLFRNMLLRSGKTRFRSICTAVTPITIVFLLIFCTALMSYSGSSDMILIRL